MRASTVGALAALSLILGLGCGDDGYGDLNWNNSTSDGGGRDSATHDASVVDSALVDVAVLPDRVVDPEGPTINILEPASGQVLSESQVRVVASITDDDGVDPSTAKAVIPGGEEFVLSRTGLTPDEFSGLVDLQSIPSGPTAVMVEASDVNGAASAQVVQLVRDTGPTVDFITPEEGARYEGSVILAFFVLDPRGVMESSVSAVIGQIPLVLTKTSEDTQAPGHPGWIRFQCEIVFDDNQVFNPGLRGLQQITVQAQNIDHAVEASASVTFTVDEEGPSIDILTPSPGQILGGIIEITADIQDDALVSDPSVVAVLAHDNAEYQIPLVAGGGGPYRGLFDSRQFPGTWIFPSLSVRAADQLGNESVAGFLVALDRAPPIASLDPPPNFRLAHRVSDSELALSHEMDPVGPGVPNDATRVPQVFFLRARIEDQGSTAVGLDQQQPISLVDQSTVMLYVLGGAQGKALVVDKDDDGRCDDINPKLVPSTIPQTPSEVLALNMQAIPPTGTADFRYPNLECKSGEVEVGYTCDASGHEERLCSTTCTWGDWSCQGQGDCEPGESETGGTCGMDGVLQRTCDSSSIWEPWSCSTEGECAPRCSALNTDICPDRWVWGDDPLNNGPDRLCFTTEDEGRIFYPEWNPSVDLTAPYNTYNRAVYRIFSKAIFYTVDTSEPAIYSLPPVLPGDPLFCAGLKFDAQANSIPEGWACVAVRAVDSVGNVGISKPLRVFVDYTMDGVPAYNVAQAPDCTGTYDAQTQTVDLGTPCQFDAASQTFPANEVRREDF